MANCDGDDEDDLHHLWYNTCTVYIDDILTTFTAGALHESIKSCFETYLTNVTYHRETLIVTGSAKVNLSHRSYVKPNNSHSVCTSGSVQTLEQGGASLAVEINKASAALVRNLGQLRVVLVVNAHLDSEGNVKVVWLAVSKSTKTIMNRSTNITDFIMYGTVIDSGTESGNDILLMSSRAPQELFKLFLSQCNDLANVTITLTYGNLFPSCDDNDKDVAAVIIPVTEVADFVITHVKKHVNVE
ncbi:hypothetical protein CERSUDRAFT_76628 [Gelatoporia subvermispora B]|uniref:Uncharacterized protein n=1 Tax=Ceriporiopsis subvermispora (strain B) TaxID=914234 RepID=M2Q959_CERS8|nr:hypothetical protein CERSUDRAFT_76628 [Gelatoporia subvermispora B]